MEEATALLKELGAWQQESLITSEELIKKRAEVVASIQFPPRLNKERVRSILQHLIQLHADKLITDEELKQKRTQALTSLYADLSLDRYCVPLPASKQATASFGPSSSNANPNALVQLQTPNTTELDPSVSNKYFSYYADFSHQELMLNDAVRTGTYHQAIMRNAADFQGKVVVDVGAGSGVLAMFAARAGAKKVYAVEASDMAFAAEKLVKQNGLSHVVKVVKGKVEEVDLPEKAEVLVSEPLGFWLLNEQMIQSYIVARDKWLLPGGQMFPCGSKMFCAATYLPEVYSSTEQKSSGWQYKKEFYGLDFSGIEEDVKHQCMSRIIVDQILPHNVVSEVSEKMIDYTTCSVADLNDVKIPFNFTSPEPIMWDSVGVWFDTYFKGSECNPNAQLVCLPTAPHQKLTCWYHSIMLLPERQYTSSFHGFLHFVGNTERTYDVTLYSGTEEKPTKIQTYSFTSPVYRYYDHFNDLVWDPTSSSSNVNPNECAQPLAPPTSSAYGAPIIATPLPSSSGPQQPLPQPQTIEITTPTAADEQNQQASTPSPTLGSMETE